MKSGELTQIDDMKYRNIMEKSSVDNKQAGVAPFKACTNCGHVWKTRNDFIVSREVSIVGYQPNYPDIENGLFLFNHNYKDCGTTMAIRTGEFTELYIKPINDKPKLGTEECEKRCLDQEDIQNCNANCRYAYIREIMRFFRSA